MFNNFSPVPHMTISMTMTESRLRLGYVRGVLPLIVQAQLVSSYSEIYRSYSLSILQLYRIVRLGIG